MEIEFHKKTLGDGFAEIRVVIPRPSSDSPDISVTGELARKTWIKFVLATSAGIAHSCNWRELAVAISDLWESVMVALQEEQKGD
jgi:hypothetical protein